MKTCISSLKSVDACLAMDFSENYQCCFQSEVQSAFFDQNQVVLHPMMAYYNTEHNDETVLVKHAIIGLTDDQKKDSCTVKMFEKKAIQIIEKEKERKLQRLLEFTDGCASQYKQKRAFYDISQSIEPTICRNYFEQVMGNQSVMV